MTPPRRERGNSNVHSPGSSKSSPNSSNQHRKSTGLPPGFLVPHKPKQTPISQMAAWELEDRYGRNAKVLASSNAPSSSYVQRLTAEQAAIEEQLVEVHGMEMINTKLRNTRIDEQRSGEDMDVVERDRSIGVESPSTMIDAKKRALAKFGSSASPSQVGVRMLGMEEALEIERKAHVHDLQRRQRMEEKKAQGLGYPTNGPGGVMSKEERERRIWAFMNYKPTDSDLEDDSDYDPDDPNNEDNDPSTWFEDDQDDGRKGQNIVEPDELVLDERDMEGLRDVIRVIEPGQGRYGVFYEPREEE
ncbi:hypothetical protein EV361DRAFT_810444 [Lentinula raphanica]|nr:hypothetical protein EV360DRAFT_43750 [Lentinula raphanica]KAJ3776559.1 hypothetical protein FB446DRAFT_635769 [Lentinula raphanica]KAJ3823657.1 hypothetical protein F5880DRAFT_1481740 [Lentinula raphanica]KAJ3965600.1 hypothetical protein EV361DRAFT_810444 [Lentinula raphanica]